MTPSSLADHQRYHPIGRLPIAAVRRIDSGQLGPVPISFVICGIAGNQIEMLTANLNVYFGICFEVAVPHRIFTPAEERRRQHNTISVAEVKGWRDARLPGLASRG